MSRPCPDHVCLLPTRAQVERSLVLLYIKHKQSSGNVHQDLYLQTHQDEHFEDMEEIEDGVKSGEENMVEDSEPSPTLMASIICKPNAATIQKTDVQYNLVRKKLNVIKILECNCPGLFVCKYLIMLISR